MPAKHITDKEFQKEVIESDKPVLVDFYAQWCGPCKMAGPILDKLADEKQTTLKVVKIDIDKNSETPSKYAVLSIPTVILFKGGAEVGRKVGFGGETGYKDLVAQA